MNTSSEGTILGSTVYGLSGALGLFCPLARYRVYDVQYAKFVCSWSLLEMGVKLLNEYGLRLRWWRQLHTTRWGDKRDVQLTWTFAVQRTVML